MPVYDFKCLECKAEFEGFASIDERSYVKCEECDGHTEILIGKSSQKPVIFREGVYEHLTGEPKYISSKRQLLDECKRHGVSSPYYG